MSDRKRGGGLDFFDVLTLIFITLKLWGKINWSCEPVLAPWPPATEAGVRHAFPEWVILGAETGNRKGKVVPQKEWIDNMVAKCRMMGARIFMKDSLVPVVGEENMIREFPSGLWRES